MFTQTFIAVVLAAISAVQGLPQVQSPPAQTPIPTVTVSPTPVPSSSGTACAAGQQTYTVMPSDTCFTIAQQFPGTTAQSIIQANPTINSDCTNLQPAQTICIPAGTASAQGGIGSSSTDGGSSTGSTPSDQTPPALSETNSVPGGQSGASPSPTQGTTTGN
ncbi:carbohydrate-binding module family 50 protein [Macrolepiota fuliginosa MF-IS2]|uniref:Carbohydrate-binding module family 50 protein n=1 Tax=Macrolepiota fuliginosa MF-IS2 TaxID=1400762 RepID=A0A9P5X4W7_9AGAR|nr:carbohydrate-binding module family 50 protein [Macrolepiota fuliginosa MF-IS2]